MQNLKQTVFIQTIIQNRVKLLAILFFILFLLLVYLVYQAVSLHYLPFYADEYGYYLDAKSFQLYNRIDAATTLNESYSLFGNAGFHGFSYSIFYGLFFKLLSLFGIEPSIMLVNVFLVVCALILLALTKTPLEEKLLIGIIFISNFMLITFINTEMTEIFHYVFSFVVGYLLYMIYNTRDRRYLYSLIALIVVLSFFRQSWIFVLLGLFPLAKSWQEFVKFAFIFLLGLFFVLLDIKLFHAPFPFGFFQKLSVHLQTHPIIDTLNLLYDYFLKNIDNYFFSVTYENAKFIFYYKFLFIFIFLYGLYSSYKTKEKSIVSGTLIAAVIFFALLTLYDTYDWREVRMLSTPLMILTVILILNKKFFPIYVIILFQLSTLYIVLDYQIWVNDRRENMNMLIQQYQPQIDALSDLGNYVTGYSKKEVLVLLKPTLLPIAYSPILYSLPLSLNGKFIRYSLIFGKKFNTSDSRCDLYVSDSPEDLNNMKLIGKNEFFYFYRRIPDDLKK